MPTTYHSYAHTRAYITVTNTQYITQAQANARRHHKFGAEEEVRWGIRNANRLLRADSALVKSLVSCISRVADGRVDDGLHEGHPNRCVKASLALIKAVGRDRWAEVMPVWVKLLNTASCQVCMYVCMYVRLDTGDEFTYVDAH